MERQASRFASENPEKPAKNTPDQFRELEHATASNNTLRRRNVCEFETRTQCRQEPPPGA